MEQLYGQDVAALLRETPFSISPQVNREIHSDELPWFNEPIEELVCRLHLLSIESLLA